MLTVQCFEILNLKKTLKATFRIYLVESFSVLSELISIFKQIFLMPHDQTGFNILLRLIKF